MPPSSGRKFAAKPLVLLGLACGLIAFLILAPVHEWLRLGIAWTDTHHRLAGIAFVCTYVTSTVLAIPGSILTLTGGFAFGLMGGIVLVSIGATAGAACAFLIGRFFARDWISQRIAHSDRFKALDSAAKNKGFLIVFLSRLSPLFPFTLINYAFGLTAVRFRDYLLATWLGLLPIVSVYVYIGSLAKDFNSLLQSLHASPASGVLLGAAIAASIAVTVLIARIANRALAAHMPPAVTPDG